MKTFHPIPLTLLLFGLCQTAHLTAASRPESITPFLEKHCFECHSGESAMGDLDLASLPFGTDTPKSGKGWVRAHDRVLRGEMPPKKVKDRPDAPSLRAYLAALSNALVAADREREGREGRAVLRRLNRGEYENALRDLLSAPDLAVKEILPEDGEAHLFSKSGAALDVSHVQVAQTLAAADGALREVLSPRTAKPESKLVRYWAREQAGFTNKVKFNEFNKSPERATFPVLGTEGQPKVRSGEEPMTAGAANPDVREQEAIGVVASSYEPIEPNFNRFQAPLSGHYRLRLSAYSVWVGPGPAKRWWVPDLDKVSPGKRPEPVVLYADLRPRSLRRLGAFDAGPEPTVGTFEVYLQKRETIRIDAARLFRSRPPAYRNPLATPEGCPGVAFKWLEVEGPLVDTWPPAGQKLLFGDLPLKPSKDPNAPAEFLSKDPSGDMERLLRNFLGEALRGPVTEEDLGRFQLLGQTALKTGAGFTESLLTAYGGVLASPAFLMLPEKPGPLDDMALATRLSLFLWNSVPDGELRRLANEGSLRKPAVLKAQAERLLSDPKSGRFVESFLDQWLGLKHIAATSPDAGLYPDYYLDDLLQDSAVLETTAFFTELLKKNLPARNLVHSEFVMVNERLAEHYGIDGVEGVSIRRVPVPRDCPRGGLLTHASILKVSANGTTTSPVLRGVWTMERLLGQKPDAPPPGVPAVEPDIRGATTIRAQLDAHRKIDQCAHCHISIDPAGLAMESFDVFGGYRENYRALGGEGKKAQGIGKNGQVFAFQAGLPVDPAGVWPDGRKFDSIGELKKILLSDERAIARAFLSHLVVWATGTPVRFGDRSRLEAILTKAAPSRYGLRSLVTELVQNEIFQIK